MAHIINHNESGKLKSDCNNLNRILSYSIDQVIFEHESNTKIPYVFIYVC